jgi:uncharacterized protein YjbJ (UPF0337 family)
METDMTDDRIEGGLKRGFGHLQDAVGGLTGDARTQVQGKFNEAAGSAQDAIGQVSDIARGLWDEAQSYTKKNPRTALAITLGIGVVLGLTLLGGGTTLYQRR